MITTPEPFVFYIVHHVMIMVSIIKGADSRTLQNISTYKEIDCGYVLQIAGHISLFFFKEVAEIAMVVLVDGEKHPPKPLYSMC